MYDGQTWNKKDGKTDIVRDLTQEEYEEIIKASNNLDDFDSAI